MEYQFDFLKALGLTVLIETVVLLIITQCFKKQEKPFWGLVLFAGIIASVATLPYLWFIAPFFIKSKAYYHLFCELFAVSAESLIYFGIFRTNYVRALFYSIVCNAISYGIGLIVFW